MNTVLQKMALPYRIFLAELMLLPSETTGKINLAWKVNIYKTDAREWWDVFVDAKTGDIITKNNLVISCNFDTPGRNGFALTQSKNTVAYSPDKVTAADDFNVITRPCRSAFFCIQNNNQQPLEFSRSCCFTIWLVK